MRLAPVRSAWLSDAPVRLAPETGKRAGQGRRVRKRGGREMFTVRVGEVSSAEICVGEVRVVHFRAGQLEAAEIDLNELR